MRHLRETLWLLVWYETLSRLDAEDWGEVLGCEEITEEESSEASLDEITYAVLTSYIGALSHRSDLCETWMNIWIGTSCERRGTSKTSRRL